MTRASLGVAIAMSVLCLGAGGDAADLESRRLAEQLLVLTRAEQNAAAIREQMTRVMEIQLKGLDVPESMQPRVAQYQKELVNLISEGMSFEKMKADLVEVYVSTFTREELNGLVAFYSSPLGSAYADKLPEVSQRLIEISQRRLQGLASQVKEMNEAFVAGLKDDAAGGVATGSGAGGPTDETIHSVQDEEAAPADLPDLAGLAGTWSGKINVTSTGGICFFGTNHETHQVQKVRYVLALAEGGRFTLTPMSSDGTRRDGEVWSGRVGSGLKLKVHAPTFATCNKVRQDYAIDYSGTLTLHRKSSVIELEGIDPACECNFEQALVIRQQEPASVTDSDR